MHPREVFQRIILTGAVALVVAHNHPSGNPSPSHADRQVTSVLRRAGELLGIELLDHVIVTEYGQLSMRNEDGWWAARK